MEVNNILHHLIFKSFYSHSPSVICCYVNTFHVYEMCNVCVLLLRIVHFYIILPNRTFYIKHFEDSMTTCKFLHHNKNWLSFMFLQVFDLFCNDNFNRWLVSNSSSRVQVDRQKRSLNSKTESTSHVSEPLYLIFITCDCVENETVFHLTLIAV